MDKKLRTLTEDIRESIFPSTVDKFWEAWYFLLQMFQYYHEPHAFRYNLNAFVQASRNITFLLQSEERRSDRFNDWYEQKRAEMESDKDMKKFVDVRNKVVKQSMLSTASSARIGLFRGRHFKLGVGGEVDPFLDSRRVLGDAQKFFIGHLIDENHSAIGEQLGVWREWRVPSLGLGEITDESSSHLRKMAKLLEEAHELVGKSFDASFDLPDIASTQVLLESDVDPTLITKWGWTSA